MQHTNHLFDIQINIFSSAFSVLVARRARRRRQSSIARNGRCIFIYAPEKSHHASTPCDAPIETEERRSFIERGRRVMCTSKCKQAPLQVQSQWQLSRLAGEEEEEAKHKQKQCRAGKQREGESI